MTIKGKKYTTIPAEEISVRQSKLLVQTSEAYNEYVADKELDGEKYAKLKELWRQVVGELVKDGDEIKDFDKISVAVYSEVIKSFFPSPSEAKD